MKLIINLSTLEHEVRAGSINYLVVLLHFLLLVLGFSVFLKKARSD